MRRALIFIGFISALATAWPGSAAYGKERKFCKDPSIDGGTAISPNGKLAARADYQNSFIIHLKDNRGHTRQFPDPSSEEAKKEGLATNWRGNIWSLKWSTNNVLRVTIIASHGNSIYDFLKIPSDFKKPVVQVLPSQYGSNCIYRARGNLVACPYREGGVWFTSRRKSNAGYQVNAFANAVNKGEFTLKVGQSHQIQLGTKKSPLPFKVTLDKIENGKVHIEDGVNTPDYAFSYDSGSQGKIISVNAFETLFGLVPTKVGKDKARFKLLDPHSSIYLTDLGVAWQPNGPGLYLVRRLPKQPELYIIQPTGKHGNWNLVAKAPLPVKAQVMSMNFITPHLLEMQVGDNDSTTPMATKVTLQKAARGGHAHLKIGAIKPLRFFKNILERKAPASADCLAP